MVVGHDMRLHSPALARHFARGLTDEGCDVLDIGMVGTEMVYYAIGSRELDGGASVTASHNPKDYAGFKLVREGAIALSGDKGIQDVRRLVESEDFSAATGRGRRHQGGHLRTVSPPRARLHRSRVIRPMKVVLDGGNGMAGRDDRAHHRRAADHGASPLLRAQRVSSPATSRTRCWRRTGS